MSVRQHRSYIQTQTNLHLISDGRASDIDNNKNTRVITNASRPTHTHYLTDGAVDYILLSPSLYSSSALYILFPGTSLEIVQHTSDLSRLIFPSLNDTIY